MKIEVKKGCLLFEKYQKAGEEQKAVDAMKAVFEPLIRRDDELEVEDLFDVLAIAAYSNERAMQLFGAVEAETEMMGEQERQDIDKVRAWMMACAKSFLMASLMERVEEEE